MSCHVKRYCAAVHVLLHMLRSAQFDPYWSVIHCQQDVALCRLIRPHEECGSEIDP